jgi:ribosome maturation factor RimP
MITEKQITDLILPELNETEMFLVEIKVKAGNKIAVFVDSDKSVTIKDCVKLSRFIESNLDREVEDFELSVSSAGLDQPLKIKKQYIKNIGKEVEVITSDGKSIDGIIVEVNEEFFVIEKKTKAKKSKKEEATETKIEIKFNEIKQTKLIINF